MLEDSSDEDTSTDKVRDFIRTCKKTSALPVEPGPHLLTGSSIPSPDTQVIEDASSAPTPTNTNHRQDHRNILSLPIGTDLILKYSAGAGSRLEKDNMKRKRGREASVKLVPQNERIFEGLKFYYIPPNDNAPLRRLRITKAREFGVIWAMEDWNPDRITHVVVDRGITYDGMMKFLRLDGWPSNIIMVNEQYPIDCIQHKSLLDPKQSRYEVVQTSDTHNDHGMASSSMSSDPLDMMINTSRGMKHLPLNDEDDEDDTSMSNDGDDPETSDSGHEIRQSLPGKALKGKNNAYSGSFNQETFSCMNRGTGVALDSNPNAHTITILQEMADYYARMNDRWRYIAYRRAIYTLNRQTTKISTYREAIVLPNFGERLALKVEEIVLTNGLRRLQNAKSEPNDQILDNFMKIYSVGISQASIWVQQGHKTLEDLLKHVHLTDNQRLGIEHYDDLLTRIPRDEVTALGEIVRSAAAKIDPGVQVIIGGSYRRGAATSGDIDCLLTKPGTKASRELLSFVHKLVAQLTSDAFIVAALVLPSESGSASKWHGCCVHPGAEKPIWRRIDLLMVPETELGAALIYFTGDDIFNRSIRLLASKKGWRLNQRGLFTNVMRGPGRAKINEGELIEGADEKRIFESLGVPWRPPELRICH